MKVSIEGNTCTVVREKGDPSFGERKFGRGESRLLYHVKKALNAVGFDLIKKRMWKDGHMVDELQQYLRSRNKRCKGNIAIYNSRWALECAGKVFTEKGVVHLHVEYGIFG